MASPSSPIVTPPAAPCGTSEAEEKARSEKMVDKSVNKERVARWRDAKVCQGYRQITVFLPPEVLEMINLLHRHLGTDRRTAQLIEMAIKNLYENYRRKMK